MQVLLVRLSSMGDLLHSLPALSDAAKAHPEARFDWLTDRAFAEIPQWHANLRSAIAVPSHPFGGGRISSAFQNRQYRQFFRTLRATKYDVIVDLQGEWKSAVAAALARGSVYGFDSPSVHEWGAHFFYRKTFRVPQKQHSIWRMRSLLAQALSYSLPEELDYGIDANRFPELKLKIPKPYLILIHATSWESKNWPEAYWKQLAAIALQNDFSIALPWGTLGERERALRIASGDDRIFVLPELTISQKAAVIAGSAGTIGLDTGLSHIAAALGIPSVTIYGATDPLLIGATGKNQIHISSDFECVNCHAARCSFPGPAKIKPACLENIEAPAVWAELVKMLKQEQTV